MARQPRRLVDNGIYHVLNRGNCRMDIFHKPGDFESFLKLIEEGRRRCGMRILGYCLMDNHWHLVLWPRRGPDLSRFIGWVGTTHVRRWREHRGNTGEGHLYQGRFKSFLVQSNEHFLEVMRYVEANPLRAGMVRRAERWPWSSLAGAGGSGGANDTNDTNDTTVRLSAWPVDRPDNWTDRVNHAVSESALARLRLSVVRGRPFGDDAWTARVAKRHGLESTLRNPWRPSKRPSNRE